MRARLISGAAICVLFGTSEVSASGNSAFNAPDISNNANAGAAYELKGGRSVSINGNELGESQVIQFRGGIYVDSALATTANLRCRRQTVRDGHTLCAIQTDEVVFTEKGVKVTVPASEFLPTRLGVRTAAPAVPEIAPGDLGFLNYDASASKVQGGVSFLGILAGGLRLEENAFDLTGVLARSAGTPLDSGRLTAVLSQAAYRRNWFDRRLSLAIGRTSLEQHGLLGGNIFDGIGLSKDNLDNVGDVRTSRPRAISGYTSVPGVLTYRLGNSVLRQVPIEPGAYSIDPSLFSGLPGGGKVEIVGLDGRISGLDLPVLQSRRMALYEAGTSDWSVQAGRIRASSGGYAASLYAGSRYGVTDSVTVEAAVIADRHSASVDAAADWLLPYDLGVTGVDAAFQKRERNRQIALSDQTRSGWTLTGYYLKTLGKIQFSIDYLRNHNGGVIAGGYSGYTNTNAISSANGLKSTNGISSSTGSSFTSGISLANYYGSIVQEDVRIQLSAPLFNTGVNGVARLISTSYAGQPDRALFGEAQLSGGGGHLGTWGTFFRGGRNGLGEREFSVSLFWQASLGRRTQATLGYSRNEVNGERSQPDRYSLTLSGNPASHWDQGSAYQVTIDQAGRGSAGYQHRFAAMDLSGNVYRDAQQGVTGQVSARGSLVVADGHVIPGQPLGDAVLVVKASDLQDEDIYIDHNTLPRTRTNGDGYATISNLRRYKINSVKISDEGAPLGLEVPEEVLSGTVHPYRGYIVNVATHMAHPARLFLTLSVSPKLTPVWAEINGEQIPVETDGSLYLDDLSRVKDAIRLSWRAGDTTGGCTIPLSSLPAINAGNTQTIVQAKEIPCR